MRKLTISKGNLDLAELEPDRSALIVGRSPACDAVLRAPGVSPVHFVVEWLGDGEFDPTNTDEPWAVFTVKEASSQRASSAGGSAGAIISDRGVVVDGFLFRWKESRLDAPRIKKGALKRQAEESPPDGSATASPADKRPLVIEVMRLSPDGGSVVDVRHLASSGGGLVRLGAAGARLALGKASKGEAPRLEWTTPSGEVESIGARGSGAISGTSRPLSRSEVLRIKSGPDRFIVRLVPRLTATPPRREAFKDPFYVLAMLALVGGLGFARWASQGFDANPKPPSPPPRSATIEIKEVAPPVELSPPPPEPPPPPKPLAPPPPEAPTAKPPPKPANKMSPNPGGSAGSQASAPAFKSAPKAKPNVGLNAPAPVTDVNAVGLLGAMKKTKSGPAAKISADMVMNNGLVSDAVVGESGAVAIQQPPSGLVDLNATVTSKGGGGGKDSLQSASTTLQGSNSFDPASNGAIGRKGGKSGFSVGAGSGGLGGLGAGAGGTGTGKGSGSGSGSGESVVGGLDRETVRRYVMAHRQEIRDCYERGLASNSKLRGRISLKWYISPSGPVSSILLQSSELRQSTVEACVMAIVKAIVFPKAPNGQPTTVVYPFVFQNS